MIGLWLWVHPDMNLEIVFHILGLKQTHTLISKGQDLKLPQESPKFARFLVYDAIITHSLNKHWVCASDLPSFVLYAVRGVSKWRHRPCLKKIKYHNFTYCQPSLESLGQKETPKPHSVLALIFTESNHNSQKSFSGQFSSPNSLYWLPFLYTQSYIIQSFLRGLLGWSTWNCNTAFPSGL